MTINEAMKVLELHNQWRKGAEIEYQTPVRIGMAIDLVLYELKNLRTATPPPIEGISLERVNKYAKHQHYLGTQGNDFVEFEEWESTPTVKQRKPWNLGKRKPVEDDCGVKWCACLYPKLTSNAGGRGQAFCLLCGEYWYH